MLSCNLVINGVHCKTVKEIVRTTGVPSYVVRATLGKHSSEDEQTKALEGLQKKYANGLEGGNSVHMKHRFVVGDKVLYSCTKLAEEFGIGVLTVYRLMEKLKDDDKMVEYLYLRDAGAKSKELKEMIDEVIRNRVVDDTGVPKEEPSHKFEFNGKILHTVGELSRETNIKFSELERYVRNLQEDKLVMQEVEKILKKRRSREFELDGRILTVDELSKKMNVPTTYILSLANKYGDSKVVLKKVFKYAKERGYKAKQGPKVGKRVINGITVTNRDDLARVLNVGRKTLDRFISQYGMDEAITRIINEEHKVNHILGIHFDTVKELSSKFNVKYAKVQNLVWRNGLEDTVKYLLEQKNSGTSTGQGNLCADKEQLDNETNGDIKYLDNKYANLGELAEKLRCEVGTLKAVIGKLGVKNAEKAISKLDFEFIGSNGAWYSGLLGVAQHTGVSYQAVEQEFMHCSSTEELLATIKKKYKVAK